MRKKYIKDYIDICKANMHNFIIVVIGNAKEITTVNEDYTDGNSIASEYYSLKNFNKIIDTLKKEGFETISYFDEMDFIHDYLTQRIRNNYYKKFIVLNFAQKGLVHGRKSLIPLFCEMNNIIHTNSDPFVCSLVREKYIWYKLLENNLYVCKTWLYDSRFKWIDGQPPTGTTVIAKLENQCSSIGLNSRNVFVYSDDVDIYIKQVSNKYNSRIVVQKFIEGYEVEFPFCYDGNYILHLKPQGIMINKNKHIGKAILEYDTRKNHAYEFYNFDEFKPILTNEIYNSIDKIVKIINIQGIGRIDCRIDEENNFYFTDINSNPHLIEIASPAESLRQMGFDKYADLLNLLIGITITRHPNQTML